MGPECWRRYCVVHSVVRSFFGCLVPGSPLHLREVQFQLWSLSCFLRICRSILGVFLIAAIALVSLRFLSVFIEIFNLFSISLIWFSTFYLVWWFVDLCIFFCNFDLFLIKALLSLGIWCFLGFFFGRTCFLQISRQILIIIIYISSVFTSVKSMSQLVLNRSASILVQLMFSLKKFKSLLIKLLFLIWWFCFSSTIFMFVSIWIILWSLIDVSVLIICRASWSLLVKKTSVCYFFSLAPLYIAVSIVLVQIAERHLLEPDFHVFHCLLFPFDSQ